MVATELKELAERRNVYQQIADSLANSTVLVGSVIHYEPEGAESDFHFTVTISDSRTVSSLNGRVALRNIFNKAVSEVGMLQVLPAGCDPKEAEEGRDIVTINIVAEESLIRVLTNSYPSKGEDEEHTEGLHAFAQQMRDIVKNGKLLFARDPNLEKSIRYRAETGFSDL